MARDELSLENLTMFDFDSASIRAHMAAMDARDQRYKDLYGASWKEHLRADRKKEMAVRHRKFINGRIYATGLLKCSPGDKVSETELEQFDVRLHELYGSRYDVLTAARVDFDPRVAELLIQEALRNHEPEVLPDVLRDEYDRILRITPGMGLMVHECHV